MVILNCLSKHYFQTLTNCDTIIWINPIKPDQKNLHPFRLKMGMPAPKMRRLPGKGIKIWRDSQGLVKTIKNVSVQTN